MDSGSVISLSSTSSKGSKYVESVVTVSSETHRIPVSWESDKLKKKKGNILDHEITPNHSEKVNEWINSCEKDNSNCDLLNNSKENNQSTCIRYDFDKKPRVSSLPKSCFTRATPLFSYMEEAKKISPKENLRKTRAKSADSHRCNGSNRCKNISFETPLSPESQKKELCSYLQLMKPDDKQHSFFIEHRRSGRVRNLLLNNENKEQPVKNETQSDSKDVSDYPTLKSFEELNMQTNYLGSIFNFKRKNTGEEVPNKYMPLPPKRMYSEISDFEDSAIQDIVNERTQDNRQNGCLNKIEKRKKFKFGLKKFKKSQFINRRISSLRSKGRLRNVSLDTLILRKSQARKKARKKRLKEFQEKASQEKANEPLESPRCEIISIHTNSDDENIDLKNFVDDMLELDKMSAEHRKSVIESRILASSSITNLINKRTSQEADVQKAYKIFSDLSNERMNYEEKENAHEDDDSDRTLTADLIISEHDYANRNSDLSHNEEETEEEEDDDDDDEQSVRNSLSPVPIPNLEVLPVRGVEVKSLHRSLTISHKRKYLNNYGLHNWSSNSDKKLNHSISITKKDGAVIRAFYHEYNLVIAQQNSVSFWTQSALGNVLGAQNMWIPKGQIQRIPLNSTYVQKNAMEMMITTETSIAYVELWTKEHKSDMRELPVADVFATVYFWRVRQSGLDKKALQLENIKGFADDVQYCVLKCYPRIIVSWHSVQGGEKKTNIHSYHLAADFQTVANISEIQPVEHYVSSLHNIEDCDNLVMGCGENKITLWNVEYGYIVATIEMSNIKSPLSTLWAKCDRGFLFTVQECVDQELRLIAINGMNHSWKKLQNYVPPSGFDCLKGVCVDNGILVAYYSQGILCWNAQTGELIVEEAVPNESENIPSGKHVIMIVDENIIVRHSLSHLITDLL